MDDMKPMMGARAVRVFTSELLAQAAARNLVRVLEWGCGGSTAYYTHFLRAQGIAYSWHSIEHHQGWHDHVSSVLAGDPSTQVHLVAWEDYAQFPRTLNTCFDLILVDGRQRARCLAEARDLVAPRGVVLLHDALRSRYYSGTVPYPDSRYIDAELWRGRVEPPGTGARLANAANRLLFRNLVRPSRKVRIAFDKHLRPRLHPAGARTGQ